MGVARGGRGGGKVGGPAHPFLRLPQYKGLTIIFLEGEGGG